jgi:hypothetical protein
MDGLKDCRLISETSNGLRHARQFDRQPGLGVRLGECQTHNFPMRVGTEGEE